MNLTGVMYTYGHSYHLQLLGESPQSLISISILNTAFLLLYQQLKKNFAIYSLYFEEEHHGISHGRRKGPNVWLLPLTTYDSEELLTLDFGLL